jgi:transaldolase/glucose-6-phosphate isomerase
MQEAAAGTLGVLADAVAVLETRTRSDHARLIVGDTALWSTNAEATAPWLGWVASLERAPEHLERIAPIARRIVSEDVDDVVLVGMGGSSLFAMVLAEACDRGVGRPHLHVLDSTDPAAVLRVESAVDWTRTVVVAASKSGTTIETRAHLERLLSRLEAAVGDHAPRRVIVVTDPGSSLAERASELGIDAVVPGDADIGGRYSALSPFGLLPAVILGLDVSAMLDQARVAEDRWRSDPWSDAGPAFLAALLAAGVASGRDALYLVVDGRTAMFGAWIEQLVAESSGKQGTGVLPVVVEGIDAVVATERAVVVTLGEPSGWEHLVARGVPLLALPLGGSGRLAGEALRWMQAVPLLCAQLGVDPFDQPDVAAAKAATADALALATEPEEPVTLASIGNALDDAGYLALLGYVDPEGADAKRLLAAARQLATRHGIPVTSGFGPRYLHSTGQLHKGGRPDGLFLVVVSDDAGDVTIPDREYGFSRLKRAQAAGDLAALRGAGRHAVRVSLDDPLLRG